jgi:GNAT superfamily N-acetyltransferase
MTGQNKDSETTYPAQYETEVLLKDGSSILLRPIRVDDATSWLGFIGRLSPDNKHLRFLHTSKEMNLDDAVRFCTVDYHNRFAFVAEALRELNRDIVGAGQYYRLPGHHAADMLLAVEDDYQSRGLGIRILEQLANVARENGIDTFRTDVLAGNEQMMNVLRDYGVHISSELRAGIHHVTLPIAQTTAVEEKGSERE